MIIAVVKWISFYNSAEITKTSGRVVYKSS
jgi:hypothetical protein